MRTGIVALCTCLTVATAIEARADEPVAIHSRSELEGGVALATLGGAALLTGSVLVVTAAAFDCNFICVIDRRTAFDVGVPLMIGGLVFTGIGVWLGLDGGRRVSPHWTLAPALTPQSASLTFAATF